MELIQFNHTHIGQAQVLAGENYEEERSLVSALPEHPSLPDLAHFADNRLGVAALEGDRLIGFLCCLEPRERAFGSNAKGVFSPIHAHGAAKENRQMLYRRMYQCAATKWVSGGIAYHAIAMYEHDETAKNALFSCGFGTRCVDAIRPMELIEVHRKAVLPIRRLERREIPLIRPLRAALSVHLGGSPCFMYSSVQAYERWLERAEGRDSIIYAAFDWDTPVAFVEATKEGENFATEAKDMMNICGAFCLPVYRGSGLMQCVLNAMIADLRGAGYLRLGVDYESANLAASGFWGKYFRPYTCSVTRRVDEAAFSRA
jgi:hypothetical protein